MIRFKISIPFSALAVVAVISLGVIVVSLVNLKIVGYGSGSAFKLQLTAGALSLYGLLILIGCGATYFLLRRK